MLSLTLVSLKTLPKEPYQVVPQAPYLPANELLPTPVRSSLPAQLPYKVEPSYTFGAFKLWSFTPGAVPLLQDQAVFRATHIAMQPVSPIAFFASASVCRFGVCCRPMARREAPLSLRPHELSVSVCRDVGLWRYWVRMGGESWDKGLPLKRRVCVCIVENRKIVCREGRVHNLSLCTPFNINHSITILV